MTENPAVTALVDYYSTPDEWPCWPLLPIKRYPEEQGWPDCAVILDTSDGFLDPNQEVKIYHTMLFKFDPEARTTTYPNLRDLLRDGWMLD